MNRSRILALAAATWLSAPADSAAAEQQGGVNTLEEIVVTAQKREQSIQDVPMSISAFGDKVIVRNALVSLMDYGTRVPNLSFGATAESRSAAQLAIAIRGVVGKGTTGFYIDDTPMPASINPLVMDLERIEVLRGPQGTLYGARSMGGTVRLITKKPELGETAVGSIRARVSTTEDGGIGYRADGMVNVPVVPDRFALRILAYGQDRDGFIDRAASPVAPVDFGTHKNIDGNRTYGGRITGLLSFMDGDLTILPGFMLERKNWDGRSLADVSAENRTNYRAFDIDEKGSSDWQLASLTIRYLRPYGEFTSSTSYFDWSADDTEDASEFLSMVFGTPFLPGPLVALDDGRSFAEELRFSSRLAGPFQFTAGVFYQDADKKVTFPGDPFPAAPLPPIIPNVFSLRQDEQVKEFAVFAEATFDITKSLSLIGGARYFDNKVAFSSVQGGVFGSPIPFADDASETGVNPKVGLQYRFDDDRMLYATAAQGFRIGGVNVFPADVCADDLERLGLSANELASYDSDALWSYEVGLHTSWLDRRVIFNLAGYYIDWKDLQQTIGLSCGFPAVVNAGKAKIQGFDADVAWAPAQGLAVSLGVGHADSEVTDNGGFDSVTEGAPVQNAPEWTVNAAIDYDFRMDTVPVYLHADYGNVGESVNARNSAPFFRVRPAYDIVNLRAGVTLRTWDIGLFVENATDEKANLADVPPMAAELSGRPRILVNQPRTIGLEVRVTF
jgi:outer membrane receptor protein involved in Fe transport